MSAALTQAKQLEHGNDELTQPAETSISGILEARPVIEVATVSGADLVSISDHGVTPLMRAACDGSAGTVRALLDRGVEINATRSDGLNALALAAFFGHSQVVWLLLENGADLAATGRSNTLPEMWADVRGFVDVGDILREARATKPLEAPTPRVALIDEPARFPRPAEEEGPQGINFQDSGVECSVIDEATDSETTLVRPALSEESIAGKSESIRDLPNYKPDYFDERPVLAQLELAGEPNLIDEAMDSEITVVRPAPADECTVETSALTRDLPEDTSELQPVLTQQLRDASDVIEETMDSEATLVRPAPLTEGNTGREGESTANVLTNDLPDDVQEKPVIKQPVRVLRTLPEIQDPAPLLVPEFRPVSAFVARVTSSRKNLVALALVVWLVSGGIAYFLIPQIRKSLAGGRTEAGTRITPSSSIEPSAPVAGSSTNMSSTVETTSSATTESTTANASKDIGEPQAVIPADSPSNREEVESPSAVRSAEASEKGSAGVAAASSSARRAHPRSSSSDGNTVAEQAGNKTEFSAATSLSRSAAPGRKQRTVPRSGKFKQQTAVDEQPKPAPLSVEVSRSRSVVSAPARNANEVSGGEPPPLNIISGKPKSKVIQWP